MQSTGWSQNAFKPTVSCGVLSVKMVLESPPLFSMEDFSSSSLFLHQPCTVDGGKLCPRATIAMLWPGCETCCTIVNLSHKKTR